MILALITCNFTL